MNRNDYAVTAVFISTFVWFSVNTLYVWVGWLYINFIISIGILTWVMLKWDIPGYLKTGTIIGLGSAFIYSAVDRLFVRVVLILEYLRKDIPIFSTPLSVVLTWALMITLAIYLYRRMREFIGNFYVPALIVGTLAFAATLGLSELGSIGRLWTWNMLRVPRPILGSTPLYVMVANFIVPFVFPYVLSGNPIIGILRCAIAISAFQLLSLIAFKTLFFTAF